MNKKQIKNQNSISMETFLRSYLEINNEQVIYVLSRLVHKEFKTVCREIYKLYVTSIPFDAVEIEDLYIGSVLLVSDVHGNIAPYKNPNQKSLKDVHEELDSYTAQPNTYYDELDKIECYEDIIDALEENLTNESVNISSVGSFNIPKRGKNLTKKGW